MPSSPQALPLVQIFDYVYDPTTGLPAPLGTPVTISWKILQGSVTSPVVKAIPRTLTVNTDGNGYWTASVVPPDKLSPAGSTYHVSDSYNSYDIGNFTLAGMPVGGYQTVNITTAPAAAVLNPAGQIVGNLQVNGTLGVTGTVTLSALTQGQVVFPGAAGLLSGDSRLAWDTVNGRLTVNVPAAQSTASLSIRVPGNDFEFGHSNPAGYGSNLGAESGTGRPFLAFTSEAGTGNNTFRTRGWFGSIIEADLGGGFVFGTTGNASADNQALVTLMALSHAGVLSVSTAGATQTIQAIDTLHGHNTSFGIDSGAASFGLGLWLDGVQVIHIANGGLSTSPTVDPPLNGFFSRGSVQVSGASVIQDNGGNAFWDALGAAGTHTWRDNNAATTLATLNQFGTFAPIGHVLAGGGLRTAGDLGSGTAGTFGLTNTVGIGNGANTNMQAPLKGTGGGPTSAVLVTDWAKVYDGATTKWIPMFT